ncbi:hypothetical protein [Pseudomonas atagonensis]|uniref:hypothetical protein n=1 Tax=Pseudomonas atagonensis TaxID=2609964 RepID=UPI00140B1DA7|nr:hypothetical protein [Pseudomonas atagonensis]
MENSTQAKIRDWQLRRLEIKEQMQLHPEKTLELSRVLDLMDEEHAAILSGATASKRADQPQQDMSQTPNGKATRAPSFGWYVPLTAFSRT